VRGLGAMVELATVARHAAHAVVEE